MLKLKISNNPPADACLLGYYHGTNFEVDTGLGLRNVGTDWLENRTGFDPGGIQVVEDGQAELTSGNVAIGIKSCRRRNLIDPHPLPFKHRIGDNTALGQIERFVYNPLADSVTGDDAIAILKNDLKILNADGSEAEDVFWDIELIDVAADGGKVALSTSYGWRVRLNIDTQTTVQRPLFVKYTSIRSTLDSSGNVVVTHNIEELINASEYFSVEYIASIGAAITLADLGVVLDSASGALILDNSTASLAQAECIAFWTDETGWTWERSGNTLIITNGSASNITNIHTKSVRQVVREINALNIAVKATLLLDYPVCDLSTTSPTQPASIANDGRNPGILADRFFAYHYSDTKAFVKPPDNVTRSDDWNPVVTLAPFSYDGTGSLTGYTFTYFIPEKTWMPFSEIYNTANSYDFDYLEEIDFEPVLITPSVIGLKHRHVLIDSVKLTINGVIANDLLSDYDAEAGVLRLSRDILDAEDIKVSYAYYPKYDYIVDFLDLNPNQLHVPDGYRLFFGVFVFPYKTVSSVPATTITAPVVMYCVADSAQEVISAVEAYPDPSTGLTGVAKLLGIFQTNSQGEISEVGILDVRSHGGGIKESADINKIEKRAPEVQFFGDIGYLDGQPYTGSGVIIVDGPNRILGSDDSIPDLIAPVDGGFIDTTGRENIDDIKKRLKRHASIGTFTITDLD